MKATPRVSRNSTFSPKKIPVATPETRARMTRLERLRRESRCNRSIWLPFLERTFGGTYIRRSNGFMAVETRVSETTLISRYWSRNGLLAGRRLLGLIGLWQAAPYRKVDMISGFLIPPPSRGMSGGGCGCSVAESELTHPHLDP